MTTTEHWTDRTHWTLWTKTSNGAIPKEISPVDHPLLRNGHHAFTLKDANAVTDMARVTGKAQHIDVRGDRVISCEII